MHAINKYVKTIKNIRATTSSQGYYDVFVEEQYSIYTSNQFCLNILGMNPLIFTKSVVKCDGRDCPFCWID